MRFRASLSLRNLALALSLLAGSKVDASPIYTVTDLGANVSSLQLNNVGQVAGLRSTGIVSFDGFLYSNGRFTSLAPGVQPVALTDTGNVIDGRGPFAYYNGPDLQRNVVDANLATAGNHNGVLVGTGSQQPYQNMNDQNTYPVAYIYQPIPGLQPINNDQYAEYHSLRPGILYPALAPGDPTGQGHMGAFGWKTQLTAINDSNQVAGSYAPINYSYLPTVTPYHAFTATTSMTGFKDLGTLGGTNSFSTAINQVGQVAGGSDTFGGTTHAFFYGGNKMADLGVLPGMTGSVALGLNDKGQVVGSSGITPSFSSGMFGYNSGPFTNSMMQVSGYSDSHAFLYSNGIMEDLNDRLPATLGLTLDRAVAINDAGQILAYGHGSDGVEHGLLLSPVVAPEPTSLALLGLGMAGYGLRLWSRSRG